MSRWEQGSHYHHIAGFDGVSRPPWGKGGRYAYSGRLGLLDLLELLSPERQKTVWCPAHYCGDVTVALGQEGHRLRYYDGNPLARWQIPTEEIEEGDLFISNCYFGIDALTPEELAPIRRRGATIIEDHSQDPHSDLAFKSGAAYCFGSLRKSLPLPDGGIVWSPVGRPLPLTTLPTPPVYPLRLGGMFAKRLYLQGEFDDKNLFRGWFDASEEEFASLHRRGISGYSRRQLEGFDVEQWRARRAANHRHLTELLDGLTFELPYRDRSEEAPSGLVLLSPTCDHRDHLRMHLIARRIYPVVYWPPIAGTPESLSVLARDFTSRMLFLHTDARYDEEDMERVAEVVASAPID